MSLVQSPPSQNLPHTVCPQCGSGISHTGSAEEAQRRILELEAQIRSLNTKAAAAADKLADYEDELNLLRSNAQIQRPSTSSSSGIVSPPLENGHRIPSQTQSSPPTQGPSRLSSLSSLLPGRRTPAGPSPQPTPGLLPPPFQSHLAPTLTNNTSTHSLPTVLPNNTTQQPPGSPDPATETLAVMLQAEKKARLAAESSLSQAHNELEELTAQLFSQANEMVATERKARAKLEERIELLEKRDGDKRVRLDRLEKAMGRIERVRGMVT
ncbi:hypothetical protein GJ744_006715 [Endocarpon pusillum]|uniref:GDP/GTP exchange factor Sec2 N-terminal domain-containing protein n=1 Tax=Endocarpon pusillum TaxID=364733 RepID=A0A8H7ANQ5_9EURO|nr:hypothetical protein GJ744_006715 [Endocarpon pusillum]